MPVDDCVSSAHSSAALVSELAGQVRTIVTGTLGSRLAVSNLRRSLITPPSAPVAKIAIVVPLPAVTRVALYAFQNPAGLYRHATPVPATRQSRGGFFATCGRTDMRLAGFNPSTAATVAPRLAGTRTARVLTS